MAESSQAKTIVFSVFIILLGVFFWKWTSKREQPGRELKYSELLEQAERGNVREVTLYLSANTAEVRGELGQPSEKFHATIPKEFIPDLTKMLREKSVPIDVKQGEQGDWLTFLLDAAPLFLLVGFWIFMMRQMKARKQSGDKA